MRLIDAAEAAWIWSRESWAIFKFIYNWYTWWIKKNYDLDIEVETFDILTPEFEEQVKQWNSFWLWLLYAWDWYKTVRADKIITVAEVNAFKKENFKFYGHNHLWKLGYIVDSLKSMWDDKIIEFPLISLQLAVTKWIYWQTARSLKIKDWLLHYYLVELNKGTKFNHVELMDELNKKTIEKALKLRI